MTMQTAFNRAYLAARKRTRVRRAKDGKWHAYNAQARWLATGNSSEDALRRCALQVASRQVH